MSQKETITMLRMNQQSQFLLALVVFSLGELSYGAIYKCSRTNSTEDDKDYSSIKIVTSKQKATVAYEDPYYKEGDKYHGKKSLEDSGVYSTRKSQKRGTDVYAGFSEMASAFDQNDEELELSKELVSNSNGDAKLILYGDGEDSVLKSEYKYDCN
jgi:hypothetical protein